MTPTTPTRRERPGPGPDALERRLREALEAGARTVGPGDLRRASPPSTYPRRRFPVPVRLRRTALLAFGLAAVVACAVLVLVPRDQGRTQEPAGPTESTQPTESPRTPDPDPSRVPVPIPIPPSADPSAVQPVPRSETEVPAGAPAPPTSDQP
ncbi:hypothetical protein ACFXKG_15815 [Streptomyces sp. NPDC059255]|uniref:hypothetical protein n=1 Tax=Streptomyces sp. NPDC059255 TaxID=3346793 RepID=UPI0036ADF0F4